MNRLKRHGNESATMYIAMALLLTEEKYPRPLSVLLIIVILSMLWGAKFVLRWQIGTTNFSEAELESILSIQYDCIHPDISTYEKLLLLNDPDKQVSKESEIEISSRAKRIVGGMELNYGEWPFLVSMQLRLDGWFQHFCGGVLIHPHYVLSAAHCFEKFWAAEVTDDPDFWMVRVGEHNMTEDTDSKEDYEVRSIIRCKSRKFGEFQNDIAFIKLKKAVTLGPYVRPICLPDPKIDKWNEHSHCLAAGWGHLQANASSISMVPHHVDLQIYNKTKCEDAYKERLAEVNREFDMKLRISHEMICAGHEKGDKDACQYDSGGPLVCKGSRGWTLAGIISFGLECAQPKTPGVYTDVRQFVDWINGFIRKDSCARCRASGSDKRSCRSVCRIN